VRNNPLIFIDPTGRTECKLEPEECKYIQNLENNNSGSRSTTALLGNSSSNSSGGFVAKRTPDLDGNSSRSIEARKTPPRVGPNCSLCPNATLISISFSSGEWDYYATYGLDIVITEDEIGLFLSNAKGPGFGIDRVPSSVNPKKSNKSLVTPHINVNVSIGPLWGDSLSESVRAYEGVSRVGGVIYFEHIQSVDNWSGEQNGAVNGFVVPVASLGIPDGRDVYTDSRWIWGISIR